MTSQKSGVEPLFRIVKRDNLPKWKAWIIRVIAIAAALLLGAIISAGLTGGSGETLYYTSGDAGEFSAAASRLLARDIKARQLPVMEIKS